MTDKIEMELVSSQVMTIVSSLRFRAMGLDGCLKQNYERIAESLTGFGLFVFEPFDAMCVCLALREYAQTIEQLFCASASSVEMNDLAEQFFYVLFHRDFDDVSMRCIRQALRELMERQVAVFAT